MAKRKSKKQKRQAERKRQLRLETAARHAGISASQGTFAAPNTGMSSPFCLRSGSDPTTSVLYRQTAPTDHAAHQASSPSRRAAQTTSSGSVASVCSSGVSTHDVADEHCAGLAIGMC